MPLLYNNWDHKSCIRHKGTSKSLATRLASSLLANYHVTSQHTWITFLKRTASFHVLARILQDLCRMHVTLWATICMAVELLVNIVRLVSWAGCQTNLDLVFVEPVHHIVHRDGSPGASSPRHRGDWYPGAEAQSVSDGQHGDIYRLYELVPREG